MFASLRRSIVAIASVGALVSVPPGSHIRQEVGTVRSSPASATGGAVCLSSSSVVGGTMPDRDVLADLNGDGALDLAVTNVGSNDVSVLLGNGDGTFGSASSYAVGTTPQGVLAADLDEDGVLDLATADTGSATMSVLVGQGDGTFQAATSYRIRTVNPQELVAGDFDGDTHLDIAVADYGPSYTIGKVSVFLGRGDGTFAPEVEYPAGTDPVVIGAGDFDRNGVPDLVIGNNNYPQGVTIMVGNGDGSFSTKAFYPIGSNPRGPAIDDFDGDGILDVAVTLWTLDTVEVFLGNGDGTFGPGSAFPTHTTPDDVVSGDLDGDGLVDLAIANNTSNDVSVLLGRGGGTFGAPVNHAVGAYPVGLSLGDLDDEGSLDIVAANYSSDDVSILLNIPCVVHVAGIQPNAKRAGHGNYRVSARAAIVDSKGAPLAGEVVEIEARMPGGTVFGMNAVTDDLGVATVTMYSTETGEFCFRVMSVRAPGWQYDPSQNEETSDCVFVPSWGPGQPT